MEKNSIIIVLTITVILALVFIFTINKGNNNSKTEYVTSAQSFSEKIESYFNESLKKVYFNFKGYNDKDRIKIKDTIDKISYIKDLNYTAIEFNVKTNTSKGHMESLEFDFKGNLTNVFKKNDNVEINFTIKHVKFEYNNWSYDLEVFSEGWNKNYYLNNSFSQMLTKSAIKK